MPRSLLAIPITLIALSVLACTKDARPPKEKSGIVRGLRLTLAVAKPATTLGNEGQLTDPPLALKVTATNAGKEAIKLDAFDLQWTHLSLNATGPDAGSVTVKDLRPLIGPRLLEPVAADFPLLKPGESWERVIHFSREWGPGIIFTFKKAGKYRMSVTYQRDELEKNTEVGMGLGARCWFGSMTSNAVEIEVRRKD